jgi:tetratricopeptide (TPR) repeat protein
MRHTSRILADDEAWKMGGMDWGTLVLSAKESLLKIWDMDWTKIKAIVSVVAVLGIFKFIPKLIPKLIGYFRKRKPFHNLPIENPFFTGREAILKGIHRTFRQEQRQVITGLGGAGKTQAALAYAHRYAREYDYIWWIKAENDIAPAYAEFARRQGLADENAKTETAVENVKNWMPAHDRWLFIFDNVQKPGDLENYLFTLPKGRRHILATSQHTHWTGIAAPVEIGVFSPEEARAFLRKKTGLPADDSQRELAAELGYLALALEQAAAYLLVNKAENYQTYLELFRKNAPRMLQAYPGANGAQKTIHSTLRMALKKIQNQGARQWLQLCAFFAPEDISRQWFEEASEHLPNPLQKQARDRHQYNEMLAELKRYSLISVEGDNISLHRLLRAVIQDTLPKETRQARADAALSIQHHLIDSDFSTRERRERFQSLAPHIVAVTEYDFLGHGFYESGEYSKALAWYQKDLVIREKELGKEQASTYNNIAGVYQNQRDYEKALTWYQKALVICEKVLGKEHPATATIYNNIAGVYQNQRDYEKARTWYQKALDIREKMLGKEHPDTASTYNNIAGEYYAQGDYEKALAWHQKALVIHEKVQGKEHPDTATTYNNIGTVYFYQGKYKAALAEFLKAYKIRLRVLKETHPRTLNTKNGMKITYQETPDAQHLPFETWLADALRRPG